MHSQLQNEWRYSQGVFSFRNLEKSSFISPIYGIFWKMLVYAKELLHSLQCLLFLLVLLVFFLLYLFVCLFFYLRVLLDRMLCLEPDLNIFLTSLFFFTFESHWCGQCCGSYNTCSWNVRPFFFLHVFVGNQSKRR